MLIGILGATPTSRTLGRTLKQTNGAAPTACQEAVVNGGFESNTAGNWSFGPTPASGTVVNTPVHAGASAVRLGISATGSNVRSESTAYQTVAIPANTQLATLTYWERPGTTGDANDFREIVLLRTNFTILRSLTRQHGSGTDSWTQRTFDLSDFAGETLILYFNVSNDGSGATLVSFLDDVALQLCDDTVPPTATPTFTATAPAATATPTATAVSTPAPVRLRAGSGQPTPGTTTVTVPLDLLVLTDRVNVAVLSLDLQYNGALLQATACTPSQAMAPLLCNIAVPGHIRLAGVAAQGIRNEVNLAQLTFTVLQPVNRTEPLTLQLELIGDVNGTAVSTDRQNGAILLTCNPESETCTDLRIYLPLVRH